eukprot:scaffold7328_cov314-Pinguiococcus_pyrenoidosus.AAC.9
MKDRWVRERRCKGPRSIRTCVLEMLSPGWHQRLLIARSALSSARLEVVQNLGVQLLLLLPTTDRQTVRQ